MEDIDLNDKVDKEKSKPRQGIYGNSHPTCNGGRTLRIHIDKQGREKRIDEVKSLLPPKALRSPRPRMNSVFFMASTTFAGGVLDRINYMVRCYMSTWLKNGSHGPKLKSVFFARQSVQQRIHLSIISLLLQIVLPFLPLFLFASSREGLKDAGVRVVIWILLCFEFASCLWNFVILNIIYYNYKTWKRSWFTFTVPRGTIGLIESSHSDDLTQFCNSANFRFRTINIHSISRLDTISLHEQLELAKVMTNCGLDDAELILHTDDYVDCYSHWPRNISLGLLVSSVFSFFLTLYFVAKSYGQ